jgi:hypothetical protein
MLTDQILAEKYQRVAWTETLNDAEYLIDLKKCYGSD